MRDPLTGTHAPPDDLLGPTIAANRDRAFPETYLTRADAEEKALRAFVRGAIFGWTSGCVAAVIVVWLT
jgi:hypothetical protein